MIYNVYRDPAVERCSECDRPLLVLSCEQVGTPGRFCSPRCIDTATQRQGKASDAER